MVFSKSGISKSVPQVELDPFVEPKAEERTGMIGNGGYSTPPTFHAAGRDQFGCNDIGVIG